MNNKGFIFTMLSIFITGIIIVFALISYETIDIGQHALREANTLKMLVDNLENDVSRGLYITSFRTLIGQIERIVTSGVFLNSTQESFIEGMLNGTIDGHSLEMLENATFNDWLTKITSLLEEKSYTFNYNILILEQIQEDPWHVSSRLLMNYTLSTPDSERGYNRIINITEKVRIIGLEDPSYYIHSYGRIINVVNKSTNNDILYLIDQSYGASRYIESNLSPSYLQRLQGDSNPSDYGIESIVGGQRFKDQGIIEYDGRSSVDALYFYDTMSTVQCVDGAPDWFRIDVDRIPLYSNLENTSC
ncbi:MAG: hypothetical protein ACMXYL_02005 [Candidatus Woesearchaeota archaeon]